MIWLTADLHLDHEKIISHCDRPFVSTHEMNETMIGGINSAVDEKDQLFILGDFCKNYSKGRLLFWRNQIQCRHVILIHGNHDPKTKQGLPKQRLSEVFTSVFQRLTLSLDYGIFVLDHYPLESWDRRIHGSFHFHGHSHGKSPFQTHRLDVGVDCHNFKPISIFTAFTLASAAIGV